MSVVVPSTVPSRATKGEERVHALLSRLPDGCVAYYEPDLDGRHPDFVVIIPTHGVLIIEVKGWYRKEIRGGDSNDVRIERRQGRRVECLSHPNRQAREYVFRLMNVARATRFADLFLHRDGPREGKFRFPVGRLTVLSNISEEDLALELCSDGTRLRELFSTRRTICKDTLERWETLEPEALVSELAQFFDPFFPIVPLAEEVVKALRTIIHPEIYFDDRVSLAALDEVERPVSEQLGVVKALDLRQEDFAGSVGSGHRIVYGVAGSGKTLLLLSRARRLAAARAESRILVLCYNRTLAGWLAARLADHQCVTVRHFHRWAGENGVKWTRHADESALGEALRAALESGARDRGRFDAVLVDEAQDFEATWFPCLLAAMKDPEDGDLLIVADGAQGLYRQWGPGQTWARLGIKARGRTSTARFMLDQNYRNPSEVIALAETFACATEHGSGEGKDSETSTQGASAGDSSGSESDRILAVRVDMRRCVRSTGAAPLFVQASHRRHELAEANRLIGELLAGRWDDRAVAPLQPHEIGVLYPGANETERRLLAGFVSDVACSAPIVWLNDPARAGARDQVTAPGIKVQTIHSAKGLQYRAVIVVWTDKLPHPESRSDRARLRADRRLLYVAMTRSESFLALTASGRSAFTDEIRSSPAAKVVASTADDSILTFQPTGTRGVEAASG